MQFRKRRGQAFETMMLVISVIVALAILGVLLGILNTFSFSGSDAEQVFKEELKKVGGSYSPGSTPRDATMKAGKIINARVVTEDTTILEESVKFVVANELESSIATVEGGVRATKDVTVTFSVCGDPTLGNSGTYVISIAPVTRGTIAIDACLAALG
ncbi:MAG: hypothetical protein V1722_00350 [Candidatus Micrarchaeota archaeon]